MEVQHIPLILLEVRESGRNALIVVFFKIRCLFCLHSKVQWQSTEFSLLFLFIHQIKLIQQWWKYFANHWVPSLKKQYISCNPSSILILFPTIFMDMPVGVPLFERFICADKNRCINLWNSYKKDVSKTKRDKLFTCAPLLIASLKEHLLPCSEDGEGTALNESCYGKCVLFGE